MKYIFTLLAVCASLVVSAQKILTETVNYDDVRLPLTPLDPSIKHYNFTISTPYPTDTNNLEAEAKRKYEDAKANYPQLVEESKAQYQQELDTYDERVKQARENYRIESEEFKKLSLVERLAMADQKPTLKLPPQPVYRKPSEPYYVKPNLSSVITFDPEVLANSYMTISGLEKGEDNAISGTIVFHDFESLDPERKVEQKSSYNTRTRRTETRNVYKYITKYKRPVSVHLEIAGKIVDDGIYKGTEDFTELTTDSRPNMNNIEKESVTNFLKSYANTLNRQYGFSPVKRIAVIGYVKDKKGEYDDLDEAKDYAISGYKNYQIGNGPNNDDLNQAIAIWESALKESDVEDRKARIDKKVTVAIYQNLIDAYLATEQFDKVKQALDSLDNIKLNYSQKEDLKAMQSVYEDRKQRFDANN